MKFNLDVESDRFSFIDGMQIYVSSQHKSRLLLCSYESDSQTAVFICRPVPTCHQLHTTVTVGCYTSVTSCILLSQCDVIHLSLAVYYCHSVMLYTCHDMSSVKFLMSLFTALLSLQADSLLNL